MTQLSKYLMTAFISSSLAFGCLVATTNTVLADVKINSNQQTNQTKPGTQVYTIDEWPEVQKELCGKCQSNPNSEENKVSVPEPSSIIALLILGVFFLLTTKAKLNYLTFTKK